MSHKPMSLVMRTIYELQIDAICDADCRATDGFYRELSETMTIEEVQEMYQEIRGHDHAKHEAQR